MCLGCGAKCRPTRNRDRKQIKRLKTESPMLSVFSYYFGFWFSWTWMREAAFVKQNVDRWQTYEKMLLNPGGISPEKKQRFLSSLPMIFLLHERNIRKAKRYNTWITSVQKFMLRFIKTKKKRQVDLSPSGQKKCRCCVPNFKNHFSIPSWFL